MGRAIQVISGLLLAAAFSISTAHAVDEQPQSQITFPYEKAKQYIGNQCDNKTTKKILGYTNIAPDGTVRVFYKCGNELSSDSFVLVSTESGLEWIYNENKPNAGLVR